MARIAVTTRTLARTPGMMPLGAAAGNGPGRRPANIEVTLRKRPGVTTPVNARIFLQERGRFRQVAQRNLTNGVATVSVATDMNASPRISVISFGGPTESGQLEFGAMPPGITLAPQLPVRRRPERPIMGDRAFRLF